LDQAVKIVGVSNDHDLVRRCEAAAQDRFARLASAARSQPYYLDNTHLVRQQGVPSQEWLELILARSPA